MVPEPPTPDPSPVQDQLIPDTVPEEPTPKSTPRTTPEPPVNQQPKAGKNKRKMKIEEVNEAPIEEKMVEARESVPVQDSPKPDQKKGKNKKNKQQQQVQQSEAPSNGIAVLPGKMGARELINIVKKTPFEESEAQQMIELLLNKQAGAPSSGGDWVDTGNKGQANEVR